MESFILFKKTLTEWKKEKATDNLPIIGVLKRIMHIIFKNWFFNNGFDQVLGGTMSEVRFGQLGFFKHRLKDINSNN